MDLSKLPKLSQTRPPPPADQPAAGDVGTATKVELYCRCGAPISPGTKFCSNCGASYGEATGAGRPVEPMEGMGAEALMSVAVGVILLFLVKRFFDYHFAPASFAWTFSDKNGSPLEYTKTGFYWSDLAMVAFAAASIVEGLVMLLVRRSVVAMAAVWVTAAAVLLNLFGVWSVIQIHGTSQVQIMNVLALAFGMYMGVYEYKLYQSLRAAGR